MASDPLTPLYAELQRLDLLLHREILRLRATYQLSLDEFRGLYISDEQVDSLINRSLAEAGSTATIAALTQQATALREANAARLAEDSPWQRLVREFALSSAEQDILLLALAPELDLKYETLYAYLNNDITRKWPSCNLALRILADSPAERAGLRRYLLLDATLFKAGLLHSIPATPARFSWLAGGFTVAPAVVSYLLALPYRDPRLAALIQTEELSTAWEEVPLPAAKRAALQLLIPLCKPLSAGGTVPLLVFEGRYGAGRRQAAAALCTELGMPLLRLDLEAAWGTAEPLVRLLQVLALQRRLQPTGVYLEHGETLFDREGKPLAEAYGFVATLGQGKGPVFLACGPGTAWWELLRGRRAVHFPFADSDYDARIRCWQSCLAEQGAGIPEADLAALADRFMLTPGQIRDAVTTALDMHILESGSATQPLPPALVFAAARAQSDQSLGHLAVKVNAIHTWDDLVLPTVTLRRIKELAAAVKYRHMVYSTWGFERRIATGKGLKALFSGASGTGKTMTASVIARELGLDLYKIDLSAVVSKYIGETEKNLDRIFRAAHASNAILFFDEADALFGKRSEVKDAHDRYANIEVAYLLQKLEEHEGVVIMASNLSKNIDEAFSRRMHYVVEFPLPDESHRERLWRGMFPSEVPLGKDVDCRFLASQFPIAGGDIKNVALDAAFLAAQDGQVITMKQLIRAMAQQMMKQGRIPSPSDFKQYHALIVSGE